MELTKTELLSRCRRFDEAMTAEHPNWDTAFIAHKVNQYYFTGTMQDAIVVFRRGRIEPNVYVRRSFERALSESPLSSIYPMASYRDAAEIEGGACGNTYMELETLPFAVISRMRKHFEMDTLSPVDNTVLYLRAIKSEYELAWQRLACKQHDKLLIEGVPPLLKEGISEAEFVGELFNEMIRYGYQGITRFYRFGTELVAGQIDFGVNALEPSSFDGPGGALGYGAVAPVGGSRDRLLKKGDLIFVDNGFGMGGYSSDKTQVYRFGEAPTEEMTKIHRQCIDIQLRTAELMKPGAIPSNIYKTVLSTLDAEFLKNFMGFGNRRVTFLGHGIGLQVDEMPVIAEGFDRPLEEHMTLALEPKKGIAGHGVVGVEDTFLVTKDGGVCLTGRPRDIIVV